MENTKWLIWSTEHRAWWKPNKRGYSEYIMDAGTYSYEEAIQILDIANYNLLVESVEKHKINTPNESMVLLTEDLAKLING